MIAPIPRDDRSRACDAARRSNACCRNHHSTTGAVFHQVELVQRIRLAQLTHSNNDLAATIATVGLLLLRHLDRETGGAE